MMAHKVIVRFKENKHDGHIYKIGDEYPVKGKKATKTRIDELSTTDNSYKQIFIEEVAPVKEKE
ncbi:termination factor Rho [Psychrobacillus sp. FSL K6-2365]|uniref:termination factor Rho n=1 Tax=Psychrobacillus sp. FSL K6-2365 TaxID=2921546 RepID=UPI0030FD0BBE